MRLPQTNSREDGDRAPKLLGTYEENLQDSLAKAVARAPSLVINVGCAEGYFAVGLARMLPNAKVHAFDIDPDVAAICSQAAKLNAVSDRVTVGGLYRAEMLDQLAKDHARVLIFMDCEGAEVDLLDPTISLRLASCDIIVETHDSSLVPDAADTLEKRLSKSHTVQKIPQGGRDPNRFPELQSWPELDRWLVVNESRPQGMTWLACFTCNLTTAKSSQP